ncbi:hypothetical protein BpHYR1_027581, partial [Brachionus plicatilis]
EKNNGFNNGCSIKVGASLFSMKSGIGSSKTFTFMITKHLYKFIKKVKLLSFLVRRMPSAGNGGDIEYMSDL